MSGARIEVRFIDAGDAVAKLGELDRLLDEEVARIGEVERRRAQLADVQKRAFAEVLGQGEAVHFFASIRGEDGRSGRVPNFKRDELMDRLRWARIQELERAGLPRPEIVAEIEGALRGREECR